MIKYNPCGRIVDWARRPYTTTARLIRDDPTTVTLKWFPADPRAGCIKFPSKVCSLDWNPAPWSQTGVGEVYGAPRKYNHARTVPGLFNPAHFCGTADDFAQGQVGVADPPTTYDATGLPTCCGFVSVPFSLPLRLSITSTVNYSPPYTTSLPLAIALHSTVSLSPVSTITTSVPLAISLESALLSSFYTTDVPIAISLVSALVNDTCGGAMNVVLNQFIQPYTYRRAGATNEQWFNLVKLLPGSTVFCIATYPGTDTNLTFHVYTGSCGDLTEITLSSSGPRCYDFEVPPDAPFWVVCDLGDIDHDDSYGFRILGGTCVHNGFPP